MDEISLLRKDVQNLTSEIKQMQIGYNKMNEHIIFIEKVYGSLIYPLNFLKTRVEYITGKSESNPLPSLT